MNKVAFQIYDTYVKEASPKEVNVSFTGIEKLRKIINSPSFQAKPKTFDDVADEVLSMMENDSFVR